MTTGQRIQQARKAMGLSQVELGHKLAVSGSMIGQYENDLRNPKFETLQRIADAIGVDVNWLRNGYTLEQRNQAMKDYVAQRFAEAEAKKALNAAFDRLNSKGQQKAVERIEELMEIPKYQRLPPPESTDITRSQDTAETS